MVNFLPSFILVLSTLILVLAYVNRTRNSYERTSKISLTSSYQMHSFCTDVVLWNQGQVCYNPSAHGSGRDRWREENRKRIIVSELDSEPSDLVSFLSASSVIFFYSSLVHSLLARQKKKWLVKQAKRKGSAISASSARVFFFLGSYLISESRLATCPAIKTPGVEGNPQQRRTSPVASPEEPRPVLDRFGLGAFPEDG